MPLHRLRHTFPQRVSEWLLAAAMTVWGLLLARQGSAALDEAFYAPLTAVMGVKAWAAYCVSVGVFRLSALAINGSWRPTPHLRAIAATLSTLFWLQIAWGAVTIGAPVAVAAVYPLLLILELHAAYRASMEARVADMDARKTMKRPVAPEERQAAHG